MKEQEAEVTKHTPGAAARGLRQAGVPRGGGWTPGEEDFQEAEVLKSSLKDV